ncbi:hypothetical protein JRO89_XS05G0132800 [Xanthoceras sorbifolium]|uniref:Uncharacterized protein n=1 Tax=Xanthoceras sorbifolium TaxID=99658 RepID=A0ABQ8I261_9ROSI|nr:hypothetical protein JRO89_XS05G0132800 [Xanthoceras sorbifolium]
MTTEERNERRRKGLCFKCSEKFGPGHVCKKLFLIQTTLEDNDDDVEIEDDGALHELALERPEISLHVISRLRTPETMGVLGTLTHEAVTLLIDSNSSHNFISKHIAKTQDFKPFQMDIWSAENQVVDNREFQRAAKKKRILLEMITAERMPHIQLNMHLQIKQLLQKYEDVAEPERLPPIQSCDHKIPLQSGQGPISVRPY